MLREMIRAEWERRRLGWLLMLVVYLAVPLRYAAAMDGGLTELEVGGAFSINVLLMAAMVVAAAAWGGGVWGPEQRGRWTYTLALPVGRLRLFALRYLAGACWLALPIVALALAAYLVAATAALPRLWFAYPGPFAVWAALVGWLAYSAGFVLGARAHDSRRVGAVALLVVVLGLVGLLWFQGGRPLREVAWGVSPLRLVLDAPPLIGW